MCEAALGCTCGSPSDKGSATDGGARDNAPACKPLITSECKEGKISEIEFRSDEPSSWKTIVGPYVVEILGISAASPEPVAASFAVSDGCGKPTMIKIPAGESRIIGPTPNGTIDALVLEGFKGESVSGSSLMWVRVEFSCNPTKPPEPAESKPTPPPRRRRLVTK